MNAPKLTVVLRARERDHRRAGVDGHQGRADRDRRDLPGREWSGQGSRRPAQRRRERARARGGPSPALGAAYARDRKTSASINTQGSVPDRVASESMASIGHLSPQERKSATLSCPWLPSGNRPDEHRTACPPSRTTSPRWYGEVVRRAELAENSPVRGAMMIKPYGYAIWEAIQRALDDRIKATGHENLYFPLLVPASRARAGGRARRRVRARGRRRHRGGREAAGGAARGAAHLRGADLVDVRPLDAVLPRPAAALQPVGQRRPLGAAASPVPAHDRVPLAGRPHRARDRGRRPSRRR